jgi:CRISPR-associated endonuclease Cas3-HD
LNTTVQTEILSYNHEKEQGKKELYFDHVKNCIDTWNKRYKEKVIKPIGKRLSNIFNIGTGELEIDLRKAMTVAIAHHDFGKLTRSYQNYCHNIGNLRGFRHEIVSAHAVLNILEQLLSERGKRYLSFLCSAAVYLHHEALVLKMRSRELERLRTPTLDYLVSYLNRFSDEELELVPGSEHEFQRVNEYINLDCKLPDSEKDKVLMSIARIVNFVDGSPLGPDLRFLVASLLLPLHEVDTEAAQKGR